MSRLDELTPGQAQYVLGRIVSDKKIRSREIDKYLREMDQEIEKLEQRLSMLRDAQSEESAAAPAAGKKRRSRRGRKSAAKADGTSRSSKAKGGKKKKRSRKATTPEAQKSRQLQGKYISLIKRFSGKERDKYKKIASEQGREEAVKKMQAAVGK